MVPKNVTQPLGKENSPSVSLLEHGRIPSEPHTSGNKPEAAQ